MDTELEIDFDLHIACSLGDTECVKTSINCKKANVNRQNSHGWTPLMYACWGNHEAIVNQLLEAGASIFELNKSGQSPLMLATKAGNLEIVKLTYHKSLLNCADKYLKTALYCAVEFNFLDIASFLINEGADVNVSCGGKSVLKLAEENGQKALVELLLARGARTRRSHPPSSHSEFTDLKSFLESLSLEKYWPVFESQGVNLHAFLKLNEEDLKSLGIKLLGPRRKMYIAINTFNKCKSSVCD